MLAGRCVALLSGLCIWAPQSNKQGEPAKVGWGVQVLTADFTASYTVNLTQIFPHMPKIAPVYVFALPELFLHDFAGGCCCAPLLCIFVKRTSVL